MNPDPEFPPDESKTGAALTRRQALGWMGALAMPIAHAAGGAAPSAAAGSAAAASAAAERVPDLPNFQPLLEWLAREHAPRLSFLDTRWTSLEAWKAVARVALQQRLSYAPTPAPLAVEFVRREEREDFHVEVVRIRATAAYEIPARVLVPKPVRVGRPAVLALHCHSGRYTWGHEKVLSQPGESPSLTEFRQGTYGRPWAEALVRRGFIVLASDAFYFGERRLRVEELDPATVFSEVREAFKIARAAAPGSAEWLAATNRVCSFYEHPTAKAIAATGATWPGIHVWDDRRTVDYLASRADVDANRIGCIGLSGGGFRTAMLIAADARIKAAVVTGWMTEFAHQLRNHVRHTWMVFVPGLYPSLDLPDAAALHAPGALLVQQCRQDRLYPMSGMQGAVDKLTRIYAKAGMPERFRGEFYDVPHSFRPEMQEAAFDWVERWL